MFRGIAFLKVCIRVGVRCRVMVWLGLGLGLVLLLGLGFLGITKELRVKWPHLLVDFAARLEHLAVVSSTE